MRHNRLYGQRLKHGQQQIFVVGHAGQQDAHGVRHVVDQQQLPGAQVTHMMMKMVTLVMAAPLSTSQALLPGQGTQQQTLHQKGVENGYGC